jgi:DNA end-binding protein Ku
VRLYPATESAGRVSMNQLHKDCHQRLRNQIVCPVHGVVNRDEIVKGYEYEKDRYVIIEQADLDAIRLESTRTIDLIQFVDGGEIDPLYIDSPYYLGPDGPVAEEAFRVIREAMRRATKVGIGKVVLHGREHVVAVQVCGKGFLLSTLRYAAEVRNGEPYFADLKDGDVDADQIRLAETIMASKAAPFDPGAFHDQYQEAFFQTVKAKIEGQAPVTVEEHAAPRSFNFMEALKQSVAEAEASGALAPAPASAGKAAAAGKVSAKKPPAKSVTSEKKKRARKGA